MPRRRRRHRILRTLHQGALTATGLLALATLACSGTDGPKAGPPSAIELEQQVADLQTRLLAAEKRAIVGEVESARLRRRVHDLEEQLAAARGHRAPSSSAVPTDGGTAPSNPPSAEAPSQAAPQTPGQLAVSAVQPSPPNPDSEAPKADLPTTAGIEEEDLEEALTESTPEVETPGSPTPSPAASAPTSAEAPPPGDRPSSAEPGPSTNTLQPPDDATFAAYDAAYVLFHEKRYREAEGSFVAFVSRYPNSELTDNAQFWIGESRYARQDYEGALEAFSTTVANYPGGNKVPDAMLKAGKSLEALGRIDQARQTYLEIQRRFPETAVALAAREQLSGLN